MVGIVLDGPISWDAPCGLSGFIAYEVLAF